MTILFLEAIAPWLEGPARGLATQVPVTALQHVTFGSKAKLGLQDESDPEGFSSLTSSYPPGFSGKLAPLFAPLIRARINRTFRKMQPAASITPQVIAPFPYCEPWVRDVPGEHLVYYNVDDYSQYAWANKQQVRVREDALIARAHVTICVAVHQAAAFRQRHPEHAHKIHHLPHGLAASMINPDPEREPRKSKVGYVGNLSDRVDWEFVDAVVQLAPELTFEFVGKAAETSEEWGAVRSRVFARENVHHPGPVPQSEVAPHYWNSAVNWMPYDVAHPFNVASSPTKIFDAFGSGRPFVSTALPEVALYPDKIGISHSPEEAAGLLREAAAAHDPAKARALCDFASGHVWQRRAEDILDLLGRKPGKD